MVKIRFIGDVHGKFSRYKDIIKNVDTSMQVGDMGVGFMRYDFHEDRKVMTNNPPYDAMNKGNHSYIRGNHDNPEVCKRQRHWIPDGTMMNGVFCAGGAKSIDSAYRTEGLDWWADEELDYSESLIVYDNYHDIRPDYVMTHDCPSLISDMLISHKHNLNSVTTQLMDNMFECHQPKIWVFGHWHYNFDKVILGTRFICLNELEYIDLEIPN